MDWLILLPFAIVSDFLGIVGAVVTYLVVAFNGLGPRRAIPYACFFLAGVTVAKFQWHITFDEDQSGLIQYYMEAIIIVPVAGVIGFLSSLRFLAIDRLLILIICLTVLLGLFQFLTEYDVIPVIALNLYARSYAVIGMFLPFISLGLNSYSQRSKGGDG
jgi:hypothetical protein